MSRSWILRLALTLVALLPGQLQAQTGGATLNGRVLDAETGEAVADAVVRATSQDRPAVADQVTGADGRFQMEGMPTGTYVIQVEHLGYGVQSDSLTVMAGEDVELEFRVAARPVEVAGITVTARAVSFDPQLTRGTRFDGMTAEEVDRVRPRVSNTLDMLTMANIPGLTVSKLGDQICVETNRWRRRNSDGTEGCHMVGVVVDDVMMADAGMALDLLNPELVESWELLPPAEAGALYGNVSMYGVLIINTRTGQRPTDQAFPGIAALGPRWALSLAFHAAGSSTLHDGLVKVRHDGGVSGVGYTEQTGTMPGLELDARWNSRSFGYLGGTVYGSLGTSTAEYALSNTIQRLDRDYSSMGLDLYWGANVFRGASWNGQLGLGPTLSWQRLSLTGHPDLIADLSHLHYDTFVIHWRNEFAWFSEGTAQFLLDAKGEAVEIKLDVPNEDLWFDELDLKELSDP